jgi:hypothetical protein
MRKELQPRCNVEVRLDGRVIERGHNLITTVGLAHMAGLLNGAVTTPFKYVALGTGVVAADAVDTALGSEKTDDGAGRVLASTLTRQTTTGLDDTAVIVASFDITDDFDLSEIGLFNAVSSGVLGAHHVFSPAAVLNGQTVVVTWTLALEEGAAVP